LRYDNFAKVALQRAAQVTSYNTATAVSVGRCSALQAWLSTTQQQHSKHISFIINVQVGQRVTNV
jgi:hypothetical protein